MKNFKQIAFGLMIGAMAMGFSAFTNAPIKGSFATRYWVNDGSGNYTELATTPDVNKCRGASTVDCAIQSTSATIPSSFPIANPSGYPVSAVSGSSKAVYHP